MNALPDELLAAARDARSAVGAAARLAASAPATIQRGRLAAAAQSAIFADALLGAIRARLEALKNVAKG